MAIQQLNGKHPEAYDDSFSFDSIHEALEAFARGEFLVVMDDEGRENEGDLICAASLCTTERMAFMVKYTSSVLYSLSTTSSYFLTGVMYAHLQRPNDSPHSKSP